MNFHNSKFKRIVSTVIIVLVILGMVVPTVLSLFY